VISQDGTETKRTFFHVPSAIEAEEAEEIGVEHLLRDIKDSTTTTLATRVTQQADSLRALQSRVKDIRDYLLKVAQGKLPVNHQITYHLQDALNLLPDLSNPLTTGSFISNTNDQLLVVYLSSLVRAVIALHALVDNKAQNNRSEAEEAKKNEIKLTGGKEKEKSKDDATKTDEKGKSS
jgi:26S proteasome regulatory subunit N8